MKIIYMTENKTEMNEKEIKLLCDSISQKIKQGKNYIKNLYNRIEKQCKKTSNWGMKHQIDNCLREAQESANLWNHDSNYELDSCWE